MTDYPRPVPRVPGAVSELIKNALTLAEADSRPLRRDQRDALRRHLLTALRPMLGQLAAETARLRTELEIRSITYRYVRDEAKTAAVARTDAAVWERRYHSTLVQARRQARRADRAEQAAARHTDLLAQAARLAQAVHHQRPGVRGQAPAAGCTCQGCSLLRQILDALTTTEGDTVDAR